MVENRQHAGIFDTPALKHNGQVPCGLIGTITVEFGHLKSFVFGTRHMNFLRKSEKLEIGGDRLQIRSQLAKWRRMVGRTTPMDQFDK